MSTLIMWHNRFSKNENEAVEAHIPRHRDSKTKKPRHRETETVDQRHRDSKTFFQRTKSHDIKIPRLKTTTSRFQSQKATTSSSCGILTLIPPDKQVFGNVFYQPPCLHAQQPRAMSQKPLCPAVGMRMREIFLLQNKCPVAKVCKKRCSAKKT